MSITKRLGDAKATVELTHLSEHHPSPSGLRLAPQELAPVPSCKTRKGCPGVNGPVPQPVSMSVRTADATTLAHDSGEGQPALERLPVSCPGGKSNS